MPLSPQEVETFNSIVANFESTASSDIREMDRRAKASEMTFIPLPHLPVTRRALFYCLLLCAMVSGPASIFIMATNRPAAVALFLAGPLFLLAAGLISPALRNLRRR